MKNTKRCEKMERMKNLLGGKNGTGEAWWYLARSHSSHQKGSNRNDAKMQVLGVSGARKVLRKV